MTLPELLADNYLTQQPWQEQLMPRQDAINYFLKMIDRGNIISVVDNDELLGYVEVWHITFEQFGRIICKAPFFTYDENTTDGNICYLANIWIAPERRRGLVFKALEQVFFKINHNCDYYAGYASRKSSRPVKVFKKSDLKSELFIGSQIGAMQ